MLGRSAHSAQIQSTSVILGKLQSFSIQKSPCFRLKHQQVHLLKAFKNSSSDLWSEINLISWPSRRFGYQTLMEGKITVLIKPVISHKAWRSLSLIYRMWTNLSTRPRAFAQVTKSTFVDYSVKTWHSFRETRPSRKLTVRMQKTKSTTLRKLSSSARVNLRKVSWHRSPAKHRSLAELTRLVSSMTPLWTPGRWTKRSSWWSSTQLKRPS